jgi:serine O-acetyltransferase
MIIEDLKTKAAWCYGTVNARTLIKTCLTDGTAAMFLYRLMQWSRHWRLTPLTMVFGKMNGLFCQCIIGRGAEFGPGFVLIHSNGVVINSSVKGGRRVFVEHQVTIGAEKNESPVIGDDVFIGAGAKIVGPVSIGNHARIGANAVVLKDVPAYATVGGIPARILRQRTPESTDRELADNKSNADREVASAGYET